MPTSLTSAPPATQAEQLTLCAPRAHRPWAERLAQSVSRMVAPQAKLTVKVADSSEALPSTRVEPVLHIVSAGGSATDRRSAGDGVLLPPDLVWCDPWQVHFNADTASTSETPPLGLSQFELAAAGHDAAQIGAPPSDSGTLLGPGGLDLLILAAQAEQRRAEAEVGASVSCAAALGAWLRSASAAARAPDAAATEVAARAVLAWLGLQEPQSETTAETAMRWHAEAAARWLQTVGKSRVLSLREAQRCHPATAICQAAAERALATRLALPPDVPDTLARLDHLGVSPDFLLNKADPQAVGFMVDILHLLRRLLLPSNSGRHFSVLDIGAKTGAGSHLLAWLTQPASYSKIKLDVSCADIDTTFQTYCRQRYPQVRFLAEDPLQPGRSWDIVIASHVIEHVDDPLAFARRLQASARKAVVLAFPFAENPQDLLAGHLHSLGHDFLRQLAPSHYEIYDGLFFSQSLCCVAVIDGQAGQPENEP